MSRGFTFVEILIVVSLVVVIIAGLFSGLVFGERTTSSSIAKSDALAVSHICFERLDKFMGLCERIEYPTAENSADFAILRERSGNRWFVKLSDDKSKVLLQPVVAGTSILLGDTKRTILKFDELEFTNLFGKELRMTLSFENTNEKNELKGSLEFSRTYAVRQQ